MPTNSKQLLEAANAAVPKISGKDAQDMVAKSSDAMATSGKEVQARALRYAQENMDASFAFASDLARSRDLKEFLEIQQRYAQKQAMTYTQQAQELARLMADAAQMAQRKM